MPDTPFNNIKELIEYARKNPGMLNYGTPGPGSSTHLGAELLKREAGFDMQHVVADSATNRGSTQCWNVIGTQLIDELRQFLG